MQIISNGSWHSVAFVIAIQDERSLPQTSALWSRFWRPVDPHESVAKYERKYRSNRVQWKTQAISRADLIADVLADTYE